MATKNTTQATVNASYIMNTSTGEVTVKVSAKSEKERKTAAKPAASFAKNIRYSIYNNGGGYTGL